MTKTSVLLLFLLVAISPSAGLVGANDDDNELKKNCRAFYEKLEKRQWIAYNPSTFKPGRKVTSDEIKADLETLIKSGFETGRTGLCTYSCSPASGHDLIPSIARDLGFGGCILGIWTIDDQAENEAARKLAILGLVDAICVGNEGLESRYEWDQLKQAMRRVRRDTSLPVSTSEQVEDYGDNNLTDLNENDWVYPNVHPVFRGKTDAASAAVWVHSIIDKLATRTSLPILVHETGWPSNGHSYHTPDAQQNFWKAVRQSKRPICLFEAFDQPWKREIHRGIDIGASWGLFSSDRQPKSVVRVLTGHDKMQDETQ